MDKALMINAIMKHYGDKSVAAFARRLGLPAPNVYTWIKRRTYDCKIISTKCPEISSDWLVNGEGEMLKPKPQSQQVDIPREWLMAMIEQQNSSIKSLSETVHAQQEVIDRLTRKNDSPAQMADNAECADVG